MSTGQYSLLSCRSYAAMVGINVQVQHSGLVTITVYPHLDPSSERAKRFCCICFDKLAFTNTYPTCGACYMAATTAKRARQADGVVRADDGQDVVGSDDGQGAVRADSGEGPLASTTSKEPALD